MSDITGRCCRSLVNSDQKPGYYSVTWDGRDNRDRSLPSGVYLVKFAAGNYRATKKLVLSP